MNGILGRGKIMNKAYGRKAKRDMPHLKDSRKIGIAKVKKAKSDTEQDKPRMIGKSQTVQEGHVSINLGSF